MGLSTDTSDGYNISRTKEVSVRLPTTYGLRQRPAIIEQVRSIELSTSLGHARPCSKERRHQNDYLINERMLATEGSSYRSADTDRLPVVELRPFTKKQWRPANSVPEPDIEQRRPFTSIRAALCSRSLPFESVGYPDPDRQVTITPRIHVGPSIKATSSERRTQHPPLRDSKESYVECEPWRSRTKHYIQVQHYPHHQEHPEGFITKAERERSTVQEVRTGNNVCTQYSCLKRAMTELDSRKQQAMRVNGTRIEHRPRKANSLYGDIEDYYRLTKSCTAPSSETQQSTDDRSGDMKRQKNEDANVDETRRLRLATIQTTYLDEAIYDAFDRSSTLPSIRVRKAPLKSRKKPNRYPDGGDADSSGRSSATGRMSRLPAYRLGVTNSLHLMSHIGKPVSVEYKLSHELRTALSSLRRNKDNGSIIGGPYKIIPRYEMTSTIGESRMTSSTQDNLSKGVSESRHNESRSHRRQYMSRASTQQRSEIPDSGIESTGGCYSPAKPLSRCVDARRNVRPTGSRKDQPIVVTATNIPTDTKGYASSDTTSGTNVPEHGPFNSQGQHNTPQDQSETPSESSKPEAAVKATSLRSAEEKTPNTDVSDKTPVSESSPEVEDKSTGDEDRSNNDGDDIDQPVPTEHSSGETQPDVGDDVTATADGAAESKSQSDSSDDDVSDKSNDVIRSEDATGGEEEVSYPEAEASSLLPAYNVD